MEQAVVSVAPAQPARWRWIHLLGPWVGGVLFLFACGVLYRQLGQYRWSEVAASLQATPASRLGLAVLLVAASYFVLTLFDGLGLRYLGRPLPYRRVALASFTSYGLSNTVGRSMISGGSVRYRFYSGWGLPPGEIARLIVFCDLVVWLGFFALGGVLFLVQGLRLPPVAALHLPLATARPIGALFVLLVVGYLVWAALRRQPLRIRGHEIVLPALPLSLAATALSVLDWTLAASVLYVLLPATPGLRFAEFIGMFLLAQTMGLVTQVPAGLGVFESVMLWLLAPSFPAPAVLGALLLYRSLYYLLPLAAAAVVLAGSEARSHRGRLGLWVGRARGVLLPWVPQVLAGLTFLGGAILIFSGATPAEIERLSWLRRFLPIPLIVFSHFLGSIVGVGLLLLARGLQRRLDGAYVVTALLLAGGIVFSLLKGFDYEEALILSLMLIALLASRRHFFRRTSIVSERFTSAWIAATALVLLCSLWLVLFSFKHVEYSQVAWWQLPLRGYAPRAVVATVLSVTVALAFAISRLLKPAPPAQGTWAGLQEARVLRVVGGSRKAMASLALLGDKDFVWSDSGNSFIMFAVEGKSWVALGDPVTPIGYEAEKEELLRRFREAADRHSGWAVFYQVGQENLPLYLDMKLSLQKLGEEARVALPAFTLDGRERKKFRNLSHRLERQGCLFEILTPPQWQLVLSELTEVSDAWLAEKRTREKGFSLGYLDPAYLRHCPLAVIRREGRILAFANVWQAAEQEEMTVDLMRFLPQSPPQIMEYLLIQLFLRGKADGVRWFNLGMAPLSGLEDRSFAPLWARAGALVFRHGAQLYNFQGVRAFKEKFDPVWEPKYLASPGGVALPRILANLSSLISGGLRGVIGK